MWDAKSRRKPGRWCGISFHKKGGGNWGLVLSSHDRIGGSYKRMNGAGKGKSSRDEGDLLLLLLFAEKKSEGHG